MTAPFSHAWDFIRVGLHGLVAILLAIIIGRAVVDGGSGTEWVIAAAALFGAVYLVGAVAVVRDDPKPALAWLVTLTLVWLWVLVLAADGVYLAFPLFLLAAQLLPDRVAIPAVALLAVVAIAGYASHQGLSFGAIVGPALGAIVAVAIVLGLRLVRRESARRGVLEERERLAREIHDTLAQGLSSINLLLGAATERMPAGEPHDEAARLVREARQVAVDNLAEARRFVHALAPPSLDRLPLADAVARIVAETPDARLRVDGPARRLPPATEAAVLRIAREALGNARRHAGAGSVEVTLTYLDDLLLLDVVDDGAGFDPDGPRAGFGLTSMRSRAEELGGNLGVESAPGEGTAVALSLPIDPGSQPGDQMGNQLADGSTPAGPVTGERR